jgi:peptidyl-prolyl cis-trans isomerase D
MLTSMRDASKGFVGKIVVGVLLSLLILSFAVWGIADVFTGSGTRDVARVGEVRVSQAEYDVAYRRMLRNLQVQRGVAVTSAQIKAEGLDRRLLASLISDAALDGKIGSLGLSYDIRDAARSITTDPNFQQAGEFSRDRFNQILQNADMSEDMFLRERAKGVLRQHLTEAIGADIKTPALIDELLHLRTAEERSIAFIRINESRIAPVAAPDDATLKTYFTEKQADFRAPEYRAVTTLTISPADLAGTIAISDADIAKELQAGNVEGRYGTPERRQIQQLSFKDRPAAEAALTRIRSGVSFDTIAAETGQMGTLDTGSRSKAEIGVAALADPIFLLDANTVSEPIEFSGQFILAKVRAITPAVVPPLDEALKAAITATLRQQRLQSDPALRQRLEVLHDEIEDLRGAGKALKEVAAAKKLKAVEIPAIDAAGQDKSGAAIPLADPEKTIAGIFGSAVGVDNEAIALESGGWLWFEMTGREEPRNLTFEEAKAKAAERWISDEKARRIAAKAEELLKTREGGTPLATIATNNGTTVETQTGLKRITQPFGMEASAKLFVTPKGKPGIAIVNRGESLLFEVTASTTPPLDPATPAAAATKKAMSSFLADDLMTQYIAGLEKAAGVEIYENALAGVTGAQ